MRSMHYGCTVLLSDPGDILGVAEVGIYKRKQESKKKRKQESDQENKKTRTQTRKRPRKKEKTFFFS